MGKYNSDRNFPPSNSIDPSIATLHNRKNHYKKAGNSQLSGNTRLTIPFKFLSSGVISNPVQKDQGYIVAENSGETEDILSENLHGLLKRNEPTKLRRSSRLVEKTKKQLYRLTASDYFLSNQKAVSQQTELGLNLDCNSSEKEFFGALGQANRSADFNFNPVLNCNYPATLFDIIDLTTNQHREVNTNFESNLQNQIKIRWNTSAKLQLARKLSFKISLLNKILTGKMYYNSDSDLNCNSEDKENEYVKEDLFFDNHNENRFKLRPNFKHINISPNNSFDEKMSQVGNKEPERTGNSFNCYIPKSQWKYNTPPAKPKSEPKIAGPTLNCGLIQSEEGESYNIFQVNEKYEETYFVGDRNHVPVDKEYFSQIGTFKRKTVFEHNVGNTGNSLKDLFEGVHNLGVTNNASNRNTDTGVAKTFEENGMVSSSSLNVPNSTFDVPDNYNNQYHDPFLISRPTKARSTVCRRNILESKKRSLSDSDSEEMSPLKRKNNFSPKKKLFTNEYTTDFDLGNILSMDLR